jgi:hypothetical protein
MSWVDHIEGTLPADDLRRAFVMGAQWWEHHQTDCTMWQSDRNLAEEQAEKTFPNGQLPVAQQQVDPLEDKMKRPKNLDDYSQCVQVLENRTVVWCVECDAWHSVEMEAMARVECLSTGLREIELVEESIKLCCAVCGADIDYLLGDNRNKAIRQLHLAPLYSSSK